MKTNLKQIYDYDDGDNDDEHIHQDRWLCWGRWGWWLCRWAHRSLVRHGDSHCRQGHSMNKAAAQSVLLWNDWRWNMNGRCRWLANMRRWLQITLGLAEIEPGIYFLDGDSLHILQYALNHIYGWLDIVRYGWVDIVRYGLRGWVVVCKGDVRVSPTRQDSCRRWAFGQPYHHHHTIWVFRQPGHRAGVWIPLG